MVAYQDEQDKNDEFLEFNELEAQIERDMQRQPN